MIRTLLICSVVLAIASCSAAHPEPPVLQPGPPVPQQADEAVLQLPNDPLRVTLEQRRSKSIPGLAGAASIRIGDITGGQVLFEIIGPNDQPIIDTMSIKVNDVVRMVIGDQHFYVRLVELRNFLVSDDFAVFEVTATEPVPMETEELETKEST